MNFVSRIRTQPKIVLVALILTFSVAVPLTVQTITADASTASVAKKKKKKKKKKCKKGYKKVTTKKKGKKGKKVTKCVKQKKATPKPTTPPPATPPPTEAKVTLESVIQFAGTKVRFRGRLMYLDTNLARCTATAAYFDGFTDPHEFLMKRPSKNEPFDEIVPMAPDHGALVGGSVVCDGVSSGFTVATA